MTEQSLLLKVGDNVKTYAQVLANVLNIDVDIADHNLIRVAGTGKFSDHVDKCISNEGNAFKRVLLSKEPVVVDTPRNNEVCIDCPNQYCCKETYEICCPINLDNEVIGVIGLASFDEKQKDCISENLTKYLDFLENIADLISAKASEYKSFQEQAFTLQLLEKMMNFIDEGVIIFKENRTILYMNKKAEHLLGHTQLQLKYLKKVNKFNIYKIKSKSNIADVEYIANVNGEKIRLLGSVYPIDVAEKEKSEVFVFQDILSLHQNLCPTHHLENYNFDYLIGKDQSFIQVKEQAKKLARSDTNLLIIGETGTGKEVLARAIHNESFRRNNSFITVICSGSVDSILEKEIFGNSLMSPDENGISKIELAREGTLFIDEITDLPMRLQGRLMEIIQRQKDFNIRIIATTSKDIKAMVDNGEFRKDKYYSMEAFSITIPPVRKRRGDIKLLVDYFLKKYCCLEGKEVTLGEDVYYLLMEYSWPGNVREVENIIAFIINICKRKGVVSTKDLPETLKNKLKDTEVGQYNLDKIEKEIILKALNTFGNSTQAKKIIAKELGISTATLYRKLKKHSITEVVNYE